MPKTKIPENIKPSISAEISTRSGTGCVLEQKNISIVANTIEDAYKYFVKTKNQLEEPKTKA